MDGIAMDLGIRIDRAPDKRNDANLRVFLGFLVVAVTLASALYLHGAVRADRATAIAPQTGKRYFLHDIAVPVRASWQDPVAVLIAVAGLGGGVAILLPAFRNFR